MAEKVGSVYIEASVDTAGVIQAGKAIGTTADKISADLNSIGSTANTLNTRLSKTSESVKSSVNNMGGSFAQAGIQFQQFVGQVQGGTSALTALSQQGADLGIVLGAPLIGVIVSLAAAIGGVLYNSIEKTSGSMSKLPDELQKYLKAVEEQYAQLDESSRAAFTQAEIGKITTAYQKASEEVTRLSERLDRLKKQGVIGVQLRTTVSDLETAKKRAESFTQILNELSRVTTTGLATDKIEEGIDKSATAAERLQAQLLIAITRLTEGDLAARRMAAAQMIGLKAGEQLDAVTDSLVVKYYELEQLEKSKTEQQKQQLQLQRESRAELDRELQDELKILGDKEKAQAKAISDREKLASQVASIGLTAEQQAAAQYERDVKLLQQANEQKLLSETEFQERLATLRAEYESRNGGGLFTTLSDSLAGLQNQISGTFAQMALGFEDSDKLAQRLGQTILTELIGATINWGIEQAIAYATGVAGEGAKAAAATASSATATAAATTGLGVVTAAAITSAGLIAAAMAPAAALTSLATAGANSAPATAGILATTGVAEGVALSTMALGGKLYGGPVQAGGMYPVTEDGRPEILKQGNRQYLLPGSRGGEVVSNKDMQQGGGGLVVYVTNTTNLSAIDTTTAQQFIAQNAETIAGAVDKVANKYGRRGAR